MAALNLWPRGTISNKQLVALDRFLIRSGRKQFNKYRRQAGIPDSTPNQRLSKKQASQLLALIIAELETKK